MDNNELDSILGGSETTQIDANTGSLTSDQTISTPSTTDAGKQAAPATGQVEGQPDKSGKPADSAPATKDGQTETAISDEDLLNATGLTETPDKKLSRLERDHAASSKEARRLLDYSKKLEEFMTEQGLEIAKDEQGKPAGLVPGKKYSKEAATFNLKFKDLPEDIQAKIEEEPQKVVDFVLDRAKKAFARAIPTMEKQIAPLSPERHDTAMSYLGDMKWETGDPKFPGLAANRKLIESQLNAPNANKALKEFYHQEPEMALALMNLQFDHARSHIMEQTKKAAEQKAIKKQEADRNLATPTGAGGHGGLNLPTGGADFADQMGAMIANARP